MRWILSLMALLTALVGNAASSDSHKSKLMAMDPFDRACLLIRHYETLHDGDSSYPYFGYGHRKLPGEKYYKGYKMSEQEADSLLRKDLRKFVAIYNHLPKYKLILGVLAYNIGPAAVNKSSVYKKLMRGDTNIYKEYISHCRYNGKWHRMLHRRRQMELYLLFVP